MVACGMRGERGKRSSESKEALTDTRRGSLRTSSFDRASLRSACFRLARARKSVTR
jgi:hypothetical protein